MNSNMSYWTSTVHAALTYSHWQSHHCWRERPRSTWQLPMEIRWQLLCQLDTVFTLIEGRYLYTAQSMGIWPQSVMKHMGTVIAATNYHQQRQMLPDEAVGWVGKGRQGTQCTMKGHVSECRLSYPALPRTSTIIVCLSASFFYGILCKDYHLHTASPRCCILLGHWTSLCMPTFLSQHTCHFIFFHSRISRRLTY